MTVVFQEKIAKTKQLVVSAPIEVTSSTETASYMSKLYLAYWTQLILVLLF